MVPIKKRISRFFKSIFKSAFFLNLLGYIAYLYTYLVGKTGNYDTSAKQIIDDTLKTSKGCIFVGWHGRALMLPYFWHHPLPTYALASPHQDGRIIARLLKCYNIKTIDGSSDRNPAKAALAITKQLNNNSVVGIISDGPRGPRMKLNKSVIYFAKKTQKPIFGVTYSSTSAKIFHKSWDAMLLPKLFKKGYIGITPPLYVPENATEEEMEKLRLKLEKDLNNLTFKLDALCNVEKIEIGVSKTKKKRKIEE